MERWLSFLHGSRTNLPHKRHHAGERIGEGSRGVNSQPLGHCITARPSLKGVGMKPPSERPWLQACNEYIIENLL